MQMEDMIQEKVVQKENELNATYDERLRNYEERYVSPLVHFCYTSYQYLTRICHTVNKTSNARSP